MRNKYPRAALGSQALLNNEALLKSKQIFLKACGAAIVAKIGQNDMAQLTGNERFQAQIVELLPALRCFARRFYRNSSDADDLVQETLLRALANSGRFEEGTKLKSWLFTIMRNAFCTRFAIANREAPGPTECVADQRVVEPSQDWSVLARDVEQAYATMPAYFRDVLNAVVVHGLSYEDAADSMNCAVGTVKSRLNRARHYLVERFGDLNS
jgi:RNA polymerase sigma-70 factor (ECF subfamily)